MKGKRFVTRTTRMESQSPITYGSTMIINVDVLFIVPFEHRIYSSVHMMHIKHVLRQ